jgi:membrane-bound lytic murein transglycosylase B
MPASFWTAILRYNNAESYAIGIGHLADRLVGGQPIRGRFPPDARGMTISDRRELQTRLSAAGFDAGAAYGVIGARTSDAIPAYQERAGLTVTGEPSLELLRRLRAGG